MDLKQLASEPSPKEYFQKLFEIRDTLHVTHLMQPDRTLATHLALGEIYDGILPIVDGIVEGYSGVTGMVMNIPILATRPTDNPYEYVSDAYNYVTGHAGMFPSFIRNEIDNIAKILAVGMYKMKFVK